MRLLSAIAVATMLLLGCSTGNHLQPERGVEAYESTSQVAFDETRGGLVFNSRPFIDTYLHVFEAEGTVRELTDNDDADVKFSGRFLEYHNRTLYLTDDRKALEVNTDTGNYSELDATKAPVYDIAQTPAGVTLAIHNKTVVEWDATPGHPLKAMTSSGIVDASSWRRPAANNSYFVTARGIESDDDLQIEVWRLGDFTLATPAATRVQEVSSIAVTEDSRCLIMADDELTIWDIESGEVTSIDSVNATYSVFVLENGLIMTSGRDEKKTFGDPDAVNMTRFWDPQTLEEVASLEGMRVKAMTPMEEGQVAFVVELDDPEAMRGEGATKYRVEVWDLDTIVK